MKNIWNVWLILILISGTACKNDNDHNHEIMSCDILNITLNNNSAQKQSINIFDISDSNSVSTLLPENKGYISSLSSKTNDACFDDQRNLLYIATLSSGVAVQNVINNSITYINSSTVVNGAAFPASNNALSITMDISNNILYVYTSEQYVWKYDVNTNTGYLYTTVSGVTSGDNFPSTGFPSPIAMLDFDQQNKILFAGSIDFIWKLNTLTNAGLKLLVASGDAYPSSDSPTTIHFDNVNNYLWICKESYLYRFNLANGNGKLYTSLSGVSSGVNCPTTSATQLAQDGNFLYVPTLTNIWKLNISTNQGIDTGLANQFNCIDLFNGYLYTAIGYTPYAINLKADLNTYSGSVLSDISVNFPQSYIKKIFYRNYTAFNVAYKTSDNSGFVYDFVEYIETINITDNNQQGNTVTYDYILNSITTRPITINKIIFSSDNILQQFNTITEVLRTMYGDTAQRILNLQNYIDPVNPNHVIEINLDTPIVISNDEFMKMDIEAGASVNMVFEYCQPNTDDYVNEVLQVFENNQFTNDLTENLQNPVKTNISGIIVKQYKSKSKIYCTLACILPLIIGYLIYKKLQNE